MINISTAGIAAGLALFLGDVCSGLYELRSTDAYSTEVSSGTGRTSNLEGRGLLGHVCINLIDKRIQGVLEWLPILQNTSILSRARVQTNPFTLIQMPRWDKINTEVRQRPKNKALAN